MNLETTKSRVSIIVMLSSLLSMLIGYFLHDPIKSVFLQKDTLSAKQTVVTNKSARVERYPQEYTPSSTVEGIEFKIRSKIDDLMLREACLKFLYSVAPPPPPSTNRDDQLIYSYSTSQTIRSSFAGFQVMHTPRYVAEHLQIITNLYDIVLLHVSWAESDTNEQNRAVYRRIVMDREDL